MPQNAPTPSNRGHSHVSIFDRRGTRSGRGRSQGGKPGANTNPHPQSSGFRGGQHTGAHGDDGSGVGTSAVFNKTCMLRIHDESFSTSDLVLNPLFFPGIRVGDVVEIRPLVDSDGNGDLTSPRISMDNSSVSGAHSSDSVNAAKTKALSQASSKAGSNSSAGAAATGTTTTTTTGEAGETGTESVSISGSSRDGDGGYRVIHRKHPETENRQSFLTRASKATATATTATTTVTGELGRRGVVGEASRFSRPLVPNVPKVPHRWKGATENDTSAPTDKPRPSKQMSSNPKDNGSGEGVEAILQPDPRREILLQVGEVRKDTQQLQASMSSIVARIMWGEYSTNQRVDIRKINMNSSEERESIRADFVEISFRDQYVGRSDMWRLWRHLSMNVLYNYKTANMEGLIRAKVRRIYKNNVQVPCGYIDSSTQPIFRSESGRFIILIQMSEEMWAYQEDGNLCFEKAVNCFLADLFKRWRVKQLNHMVTIVMFSRWYYHVRDSLFFQDLVYDDHSGLYYRDYYKVVADMEVHQDWSVLLPEILSEFNTYRRDIQELCTQTGHRLRGDLSKASQGNILEAINMGINSFATNHVDRDLSRTGLSTIVITPSFGVFDVQKRLLRMTTERMLHFGIRVDLVCLAAQPLFRPPVFQFKSMLVPSEQEQRRALLARARARMDARRAKDTELNSVSPHAESPGPGAYANVVPGPFSGNTAKERAAKGVTAPDREATVTVDPIMLDPLYFDEDKWETKILPYLSGQLPRERPASGLKYVRTNTWQYGPPTDGSVSTAAGRSSSVPNQKRDKTDASEPWKESIVHALLPENDNADDMPDTIRGLTMSDFSYFCERDDEKKKDRRVTYCYFPYWIDCGFYNYTDESPAALKGNFRPSCKMGDLSVTGVPRYLRDTPLMPDLKLKHLDTDLASLLGGDSMTGSDLNSPMQDEESQSINGYRFAAQTKEFSHGSIGLLGQQPSITEEERERMIEVFRMYDHEALVSTGSTRIQPSLLEPSSTAPDAPSSLSLLAAHVLTTGTTETHQLSEQSSQGSNAPANALAQWDDAQATPALESKSTSAGKADGASTGSVENIGHMAATVSASASPNLGPGQHIKPPARPEQPQAMSSSVPHEPKVAGPGSSGHSNQRTSIFVRSSNVAHRKRSQQLQVEHSVSSPGKSMATSATTTGTSEAAGRSALRQPDKQRRLSPSTSSPPSDSLLASAVLIGGRGNGVEATSRQHLQRISESPVPISQSQINAMASGTDKPSSGASTADNTARSDRMGVSESIARQSHLDDHVRTFKGIGNQEQQHSHGQPQQQQQHRQQQQQPSSHHHHHPIVNNHLQMGAIAMPSAGPLAQRHLGFNGGIAGESDFQLTLPGRKQVTPVGAVLTQPPVPAEYNSSSPQNLKAAWLADRALLAHVPESSPRCLRRGYYYPYNPCNPALYPLPHTELSQRWAFAFANYSSLSSYTPKWRSLCTPASLPLVTDYFPTDLETYYQLYTYHLQTPEIAMEDLIELPPEDFAEFVPFMAGRAAAEAAAARYRELTGESARIDQSTRIMLKEMIYQRLAQGFQFIATRESRATRGIRDITARTGARASPLFKSGNRSDTGGEPYMPVVPVGLIDKLDESVWLSNGREIQKLEFHNGTNTSHVPGVNVSRWERKKPYDCSDVEYR
ncbi:vacuolar membrane-associated protein iml1, partial [Coemansia erecta]